MTVPLLSPSVGRFARPDPADSTPDDQSQRFVSLACVSYGDEDAHARLEQARQLLAHDPSLGSGSIAALAATGGHEDLSEAVSHDPIRSAVHHHFGDNLTYSLSIGVTHRDDAGGGGRCTTAS